MSAYVYLARMKMLTFLTYRFEVITSLGGNFIVLMAGVFLWKTAYAGVETVSGVTERQMLTYVMISILLGSFFSTNVEHIIQERMARGDIAVDFMRPVNMVLAYLAEDIGISLSSVISRLIPLLAAMFAFVGAPVPPDAGYFLLFLLSSAFGFLILWLISALIATTCFWAVQMGEIKTIKDGVVLLLSGKIIPVWFFPKGMRNVLDFLPFQYVYQTPLSIYIKALSPHEIPGAFGIQAAWILMFGLLLGVCWKKARKRILIQGG